MYTVPHLHVAIRVSLILRQRGRRAPVHSTSSKIEWAEERVTWDARFARWACATRGEGDPREIGARLAATNNFGRRWVTCSAALSDA